MGGWFDQFDPKGGGVKIRVLRDCWRVSIPESSEKFREINLLRYLKPYKNFDALVKF